ncbi:GroES-like protein [Aaosphaeria arxii CBS 175.79]|uniref:GroES-like protein n=1 Tax=Aaosphaeria arxii CBS 175.79 TaxID=1450172 RepID=A0A6A5Y6H4_9PLEO|nr:GroES-like protein [Aaosphaeria arxii CBS 175.79]KAF2021162.1 GroES-like protein [Aaosphaeria arxii CBS 175.79]
MTTTKVPSRMRAAILEHFNEPYKLIYMDTPLARYLEGHDILVQVLAASYCHTDAVFALGSMGHSTPRVGCHEFAGQVVALGPQVEVESLGLTVGSKVGVPGRGYRPCGECKECIIAGAHPKARAKRYSPFCPHMKNLGFTADGGFQQYAIVDSRQVAPLPECMTAVQAAPLMCAGLTVWAALELARNCHGARKVAIIGAGGGLGHIGVQFAAHLGMDVLAVDASDAPLSLLSTVIKSLPSSMSNRVSIHDARRLNVERALQAVGENRAVEGELAGVDAVVLLPDSQAAFDTGMKLLRNHGTMVVVSFPKNGFNLDAKDVVFRDIRVVGSLVGYNHQLRDMLAFADANAINVSIRTFALDDIQSLVQESHRGEGGKLVVDMSL